MEKICINDLRKAYELEPLPGKEGNKVYCGIDLSSQRDSTGYCKATPQGDIKSLHNKRRGPQQPAV